LTRSGDSVATPGNGGDASDRTAAPSGSPRTGVTSARAALLVFAVVLIAAFVLYVVNGRTQWFFFDEWDFLAGRKATSINDLFRPHVQHWSTLPILVYRGLFNVFGLRTYVPYQLPVIALHLVAAGLLRAIMRRLGVDPWIATAAAGLFALFGAASENIVWAFQLAWQMSLVFGLLHLILADHDGPVTRRDAYGLGLGALGLMCSGVAVTMTLVVGIAVLIRRGWRLALFHTVPLAAIYLVWFLAIGHQGYDDVGTGSGTVLRFAVRGYGAMFDALGQLPFYGWALGAMTAAGLVLAWRALTPGELRKQAAIPVAGLIGAFVFYVLSALGRAALFFGQYGAGRYMHIAAALTLPAVAVAANAFVQRWRVLLPVMFVLLLLGVPGNVNALADRDEGSGQFFLGGKPLFLALAHVPALDEVPANVRPRPGYADAVTAGWLRTQVRHGRIPEPHDPAPATVDRATLDLSLSSVSRRSPSTPCPTLRAAQAQVLERGDAIALSGGPLVVVLGRGRETFTPPADGLVLVAQRGPLRLQLLPADAASAPEVCIQER
jgi:hypothetical protein